MIKFDWFSQWPVSASRGNPCNLLNRIVSIFSKIMKDACLTWRQFSMARNIKILLDMNSHGKRFSWRKLVLGDTTSFRGKNDSCIGSFMRAVCQTKQSLLEPHFAASQATWNRMNTLVTHLTVEREVLPTVFFFVLSCLMSNRLAPRNFFFPSLSLVIVDPIAFRWAVNVTFAHLCEALAADTSGSAFSGSQAVWSCTNPQEATALFMTGSL